MDRMFKVYDSEIKESNVDERSITAVVSTATIDRMGEVLIPEGADLTAFRKNPVVLFAHNYQEPPIGKALWIKKTADGIISKVQFAKTQFAEEIFNLYKDGFMKAFSVGFIPKKWDDTPEEKCNDGKKPKRKYTDWEMIEYSAVPVPANPDALALAIQRGLHVPEVIQKEWTKDETITPDNMDSKAGMEAKQINDNITTAVNDTYITTVTYDNKDSNILSPSIDMLKAMEQEIEQLQDQLEQYQKEAMELKYRLYQIIMEDKKKPETISGMTGDQIERRIGEVVVRVIKNITGKVS